MPTSSNTRVLIDSEQSCGGKQTNRFLQYRTRSLFFLMTIIVLVFGFAEFVPEYTGTCVQFVVISLGLAAAGLGVLFGRDDERAFCVGVIVSSGVLSAEIGQEFRSLCWRGVHFLLAPYLEAHYFTPVYNLIVSLLLVLIVILNGILCLWMKKKFIYQ